MDNPADTPKAPQPDTVPVNPAPTPLEASATSTLRGSPISLHIRDIPCHADDNDKYDDMGGEAPPDDAPGPLYVDPPLLECPPRAGAREVSILDQEQQRLLHLQERFIPALHAHFVGKKAAALSATDKRWITLTVKARTAAVTAPAEDPPGHCDVRSQDPALAPAVHWWRWPRAMREALRVGQKLLWQRLPRPRRLKNYKSVNCSAVHLEFNRLIEQRFIEGPFSETSPLVANVSPIGAVDKKETGKKRIFYDLTRGGVNKNLLKVPFALPTPLDAANLMHPTSWAAKLDLADGFYHCRLHEDDRPYLGLRAPAGLRASAAAVAQWGPGWEDRVDPDGTADASGLLFRGTRLLFGLGSSPYHFCSMTNWVAEHMRSMGVQVLVFVDDFLVVGDSARQCLAGVHALRAVLRFLGLKEKQSKYEPPTQLVEFLGLELQAIEGRIALPPAKRRHLQEHLAAFAAAHRSGAPVARTLLETLIGKLSFASAAIPSGRTFLRRMYDGMYTHGSSRRQQIVLTEQYWLDFDWWCHALDTASGSPMPRRHTGGLVATWTDASGAAHGHTIKHRNGANERYTRSWGGRDGERPSNWRELYAVLDMIRLHGPRWRGQRVVTSTDNITTQAAINKGTSPSPSLMVLVRSLRAAQAEFEIDLVARWVSGDAMIVEGTDGLSRPPSASPPTFQLRGDVRQFWQGAYGHDSGEVITSLDDMGDPAGRNLMCILPFSDLPEAFRRLRVAKGAEPAYTGCTILAPDWPTADWRSELRYFDDVGEYRRGTRLFGVGRDCRFTRATYGVRVFRMPRAREAALSRRQRRARTQLAADAMAPPVTTTATASMAATMITTVSTAATATAAAAATTAMTAV
jgi:hypothetical protein